MLHIVCRLGLPEVVRVMLDCGTIVQVSDDLGRTPLHTACWATSGMKQQQQSKLPQDQTSTNNNIQPVTVSSASSLSPSYFRTIDLLLQKDVFLVHMTDNRFRTPLSYVNQRYHTEWKQYLLSRLDIYWPIRNIELDGILQPPLLIQMKANSHPLFDPPNALETTLANMVARGQMDPDEAVILMSPDEDNDEDDDDNDEDDEGVDEDEIHTENNNNMEAPNPSGVAIKKASSSSRGGVVVIEVSSDEDEDDDDENDDDFMEMTEEEHFLFSNLKDSVRMDPSSSSSSSSSTSMDLDVGLVPNFGTPPESNKQITTDDDDGSHNIIIVNDNDVNENNKEENNDNGKHDDDEEEEEEDNDDEDDDTDDDDDDDNDDESQHFQCADIMGEVLERIARAQAAALAAANVTRIEI